VSQNLLSDLARYSQRFPDYGGTVERRFDGSFSLRYFAPSIDDEYLPESAQDARREHNQAARMLDSLAPKVIAILRDKKVKLPIGETPGASLMAWVLLPSLPKERLSASCLCDAFESLRSALVPFIDHCGDTPKPREETPLPLNERMLQGVDPSQGGDSRRAGWTANQWAELLECSERHIRRQEAWKAFDAIADRNRKKRTS
jgi:hypothetical protein